MPCPTATPISKRCLKRALDVVSVCTHAPLHVPVAIAAAEAGVNVLSEKPLSTDLENADRMVAACKEAGVRLAVSHQYRFTPLFRHAKEWIDRDGWVNSVPFVRWARDVKLDLS